MAWAQVSPPATRTPVEIFVLTFGPGDHPFSKFGHNAVLVLDRQQRTDRVYNFGTFSAESPTLIRDFMQGRLMYWVSVGRMRGTLAAYAGNNRSITAQKLNLTADETERLVSRLHQSALPENRYYRYHYYLDNCSTKVRDLLNEVLGGLLERTKTQPAKLSWREHTSRLTEDSLGVNLGLNVALAGSVDQPRSRWDEMFLPSVLQDELGTLTKTNGSPLVSRQALWHQADRPPLAAAAPNHVPLMLAIGGCLGGALLLLWRRRPTTTASRYLFAGLAGLIGLLAGVLGCIFVFFWLFTDHEIAHANENILLFPPWALGLTVVCAGWARAGDLWLGRLRLWSVLLALGSVLSLLLKLLPWFRQDTWMFAAIMTPIWVMLAWAVRQPAPSATPAATTAER